MPGTFSHHRFDTQTDARAFLYDDRERIWVSTRDYEIILHDNRLNRLGYLRSDGSIVSTPSRFEAPIYAFEMDEEGVIWMGSRFSGLYRLTPQGNRYHMERFTPRPEDSYSISDNNIYDIHPDRHGRLWIATYGGGLNLVEEQGNKLRFLHAGNRLNYPLERHSQLRVIEETPEGIFLGSTNGLVHFPHTVGQSDSIPFTCYEVPENDIDGLLSSDVRDIHYTSNGELYLLSFSGGLSRLKRDEQGEIRFENFTEKEGLPSAQVLSMIEDADGSQWILSETIVFRFDPATGYFEHYGERYSNEKYYFSEAKPILHGDHLLVGTSNGFCLVPTRETQSPFVPPLMLSELIVEGEPHTEGLGQLDRIELGPDERDLQLSFVALDYVNPGAIRYAYRLDGELENWQHLGKQRHLHFVNLHRGEHTLRIRSTDSNGRWVANDYVLRIEVKPTFWETPWAWSLYCLIVILLVYLWTHVSQLRSRVAMEQELSDIKLRFFTDISHELRTPLTLISAPIELLLKREKLSDEGRQQMLVVRNNTERLMTLVNQILDFRKIESKKMRLLLERLRDDVASEMDFEAICDDVSAYSAHTGLLFVLESMKNLANNGRVSPIVAKLVGIAGIRIIGKASDEGTLETLHKCRGDEKSLKTIMESLVSEGYVGGKISIGHCQNLEIAENLRDMILTAYKNAKIEIHKLRGLCSFYAEKGGVLIGFEKN